MKVYLLIENGIELRCNIKNMIQGIYTNYEMARKKFVNQNNHILYEHEAIADIELEGYKGDSFDYELTDVCKHYDSKLNTIRKLISCLYELEGCLCGGMAHVVVDDDNFDDSTIKLILEDCDKPEYTDRPERGLVKLIMEELLSITIQQRALLFSGYYGEVLCDHKCDECEIEKGECIYD